MHYQANGLREIIGALPEGAASPIFVKGFSTFAATGDDLFVRSGGDIDLVAAEPELLYEVMTKIGYETDDKRETVPHCAEMHRGGMTVEIHSRVARGIAGYRDHRAGGSARRLLSSSPAIFSLFLRARQPQGSWLRHGLRQRAGLRQARISQGTRGQGRAGALSQCD